MAERREMYGKLNTRNEIEGTLDTRVREKKKNFNPGSPEKVTRERERERERERKRERKREREIKGMADD